MLGWQRFAFLWEYNCRWSRFFVLLYRKYFFTSCRTINFQNLRRKGLGYASNLRLGLLALLFPIFSCKCLFARKLILELTITYFYLRFKRLKTSCHYLSSLFFHRFSLLYLISTKAFHPLKIRICHFTWR